jgi:regulatory protein
VRLEDGSLFVMDADFPGIGNLSVGCTPVESERAALAAASETYHCRRKALDLLARSEQCRKGLQRKLLTRKFSSEAITAALDRLEGAGLLDDLRFAEVWLRSRLRGRPEGPPRLLAALASKGVRPETARLAIGNVLGELGDEEGLKTLERAWEKLSGRSGMTQEKLMKTLLARGFSPSMIRRFLENRGER